MALNLINSASFTPLALRMRTSGGPPATARLLAPLGSGTLSAGRVAVVASPGGSALVPLSRRRCTTGNNNQSPQSDLEYFLEEMKKFKESRPTTAKESRPFKTNRLDAAYIAKKCLKLIEELLRKYNTHPLPTDALQEVCSIGRSFLELLEKWNSGSLTPDGIELVIPGLTRIAEIFLGEVHLTESSKDVCRLPLTLPPVTRFRLTYRRVKSKYPHIKIE